MALTKKKEPTPTKAKRIAYKEIKEGIAHCVNELAITAIAFLSKIELRTTNLFYIGTCSR